MLGVEKNGKFENEIKCRGFYLGNLKTDQLLTVHVYEEFIHALENDDLTKRKLIPQHQILLHPKTKKMFSKYQLKAFTNSTFEKRIIVTKEGHCTMTLPYGYNENLLLEVEKIMKPLKL